MRIAVLIIGLALALLIFFQGCTYGYGEEANSPDSDAAGWLYVTSFGFLIGSGLVVAWPLAATVVFVVGALSAIVGGSSTTADDQWVWMALALGLAAMSFFGWRGKKRDAARKDAEQELVRKAMTVMASGGTAHASGTVVCPRCASEVPANVRFCPHCGLSRAPQAT